MSDPYLTSNRVTDLECWKKALIAKIAIWLSPEWLARRVAAYLCGDCDDPHPTITRNWGCDSEGLPVSAPVLPLADRVQREDHGPTTVMFDGYANSNDTDGSTYDVFEWTVPGETGCTYNMQVVAAMQLLSDRQELPFFVHEKLHVNAVQQDINQFIYIEGIQHDAVDESSPPAVVIPPDPESGPDRQETQYTAVFAAEVTAGDTIKVVTELALEGFQTGPLGNEVLRGQCYLTAIYL